MSGIVAAGTAGFRRVVGIALVVFLGLLASCGGGSQPFQKLDGGPSGKSVPPISLAAISGLPESKLQPLKDALAASAGKRDVAIIEGTLDDEGFNLSGTFQIMSEAAMVRLAYSWTLADKGGAIVHTIAAEETVPGTAAADPWSLITPAVLERVAAYTAESLSSRLAQMGYATQVGGLPPPLENYAVAGPGAEHDIDYETLYGPGKAEPVSAAADPPLQAPPISREPESSTANSGNHTEKGSRRQIKAVALLPVQGAQPQGNADLTAAMREALALAG